MPEELYYTTEHEWMKQVSSNQLRVGITDFAQSQLGDIVYVELPEIGQDVEQGDSIVQIESTKSVSDLYAPISGKIRNINEQLQASPDVVNADPYNTGWIIDIEFSESDLQEVLDNALDHEQYAKISHEE